MQKQATRFSYEQLMERLGALVAESKKMILVVPVSGCDVCLHSTSFNYKDVQQLTYILQRTPCEWSYRPVSEKLVGLYIYLFY